MAPNVQEDILCSTGLSSWELNMDMDMHKHRCTCLVAEREQRYSSELQRDHD